MNTIELKVNAKINLSLNIVSNLSCGYHCLDTVMVSVNIADTIIVSRRHGRKLNVRMVDGAGRAVYLENKRNSAYRAAFALMDELKTGGLDITVIKRIPFAAGLGGSSADAAGVIAALSKMYGNTNGVSAVWAAHPAVPTGSSIIAQSLGSDIPFMLEGGFARVTGKGEKVEALGLDNTLHIVVAKGKAGCSTKASYAKFDEIGCMLKGSSDAITEALRNNDIDSAGRLLHNDLQTPSIAICPGIQTTLDLLRATNPVNCIMSGSGSACFGLYRTEAEASAAAESLKGKIDFAEACRTTPSSVVFL